MDYRRKRARNVMGIVGWKNSGKTTLVEALVREFVERGLTVSTIKHAHHDFDIDTPGKDSYRHRMAGAKEVVVASAKRWALVHELRGAEEPSLEELIDHTAPCDLILVEGFKSGSHRKIEVARDIRPEGLIADRDETVCAVASDNRALVGKHRFLPLQDAAAIADFILWTFEPATV